MNVMEKCILGQVDLQAMAHNARAEAPKYEAKNALKSDSNLKPHDLETRVFYEHMFVAR
jgi:hypothetical protein